MHQEPIPIYKYIKNTPTWAVRVIYLLAIATWGSVLYGYSRTFTISHLYFFLIGPSIIFFTVYFILSYSINIFYKQPDIKAHQALVEGYWHHLSEPPSVDIFITTCGESSAVLENTFQAVAKLNYPNKKIYVLDDKGLAEHQTLAEKSGFNYLSRENKGYMKKAGNLKYGYEHSNGEFIIIFDADFAPDPEFIKQLLPYMADPNVGIVQSPQYFQMDEKVHHRNLLEYGASHVQEDFYRFVQVARDRLGAPICCGSNAIYRRQALESIGGIAQIEHSEDMYTGFRLLDNGWKVKYVPLILAIGLCPDNLQSYFHQQQRWCSGSVSLILYKNFWQSKLSPLQKMCFISGFLYYASYPLTILLSFQIFFFLFGYYNYLTLLNALPYIPSIVFLFFVVPYFRLSRSRPGGLLARTACTFFYSQAVVMGLINKTVKWQPTNTKRSGISKAYQQLVLFNAAYFLSYMVLIGVALERGLLNVFNINADSILFLIFYNLITNAFLLFHLYSALDDLKQKQLATAPASNPSLALWRLKTAGLYSALIFFIFAFAVIHK
jgi:cellulose synthase/poly-beta-1,6-N-acetylglucosamine synthase-like glycosyltransferase